MDQANNLGYLIHHLAFSLDKQSDQVLHERLGFGLSQFKVLIALKWLGHATQREIADYLGQTEASVSRQVKIMQKKGWLDVAVNPRNRRQKYISVTLKGDRLNTNATKILNAYHQPAFAALSAKELLRLSDTLNVMHSNSCALGSSCPINQN